MSKATEAAKRILEGLGDTVPFHIMEVTKPDDDPILATVRKADGFPAIAPHPESISILTGPRAVFTFIEKGPVVIKALLEEIEGKNQPETVNTASVSPETA